MESLEDMVERALVQDMESDLYVLKVLVVIAVGRSVGMRRAGSRRGVSIGRYCMYSFVRVGTMRISTLTYL